MLTESGRIRTELGLALVEDGEGAAAWEHQEEAAMVLPGKHELSKRVFAALGDPEEQGLAPG